MFYVIVGGRMLEERVTNKASNYCVFCAVSHGFDRPLTCILCLTLKRRLAINRRSILALAIETCHSRNVRVAPNPLCESL